MSRVRWAILAAVLMLTASPAIAQIAAQSAPTLYLCIYKAGPAWQAGKPMSAQALGPHAAFIKRLLDGGQLFAGGPMLDADGGLAIVRAASAEDAKAIFEADPALASGIFVGEIHPWKPVYDSGKPLRP